MVTGLASGSVWLGFGFGLGLELGPGLGLRLNNKTCFEGDIFERGRPRGEDWGLCLDDP